MSHLRLVKENPVTGTIPVPGVSLTSATGPDIRQFIHGLTAIWVPVLVLLGIGTETEILFWVGLGLGLFDALVLSYPNTADKARAITYALGALIQAALIAFGTLTETNAAILIGAAVSSVVSFIALRYTPSAVIEPNPPVKQPPLAA